MRDVPCIFMLIICFMGFNNSAIEKVNPCTWFRNENITKEQVIESSQSSSLVCLHLKQLLPVSRVSLQKGSMNVQAFPSIHPIGSSLESHNALLSITHLVFKKCAHGNILSIFFFLPCSLYISMLHMAVQGCVWMKHFSYTEHPIPTLRAHMGVQSQHNFLLVELLRQQAQAYCPAIAIAKLFSKKFIPIYKTGSSV